MSKQLRQVGAMGRAVINWLRYDLPEIVAPASMPNPPGVQPPPRKTPGEVAALFQRAFRRYVDTWDAQKMRQEQAVRELQHTAERVQRREEDGPSLGEEFAAAAKGGSQALKPFLSNVYASRMVAYKNAVQQFVEGYKQGFQQAMNPEVPAEAAGQMAAQAQAAAAAGEQEQENQEQEQQLWQHQAGAAVNAGESSSSDARSSSSTGFAARDSGGAQVASLSLAAAEQSGQPPREQQPQQPAAPQAQQEQQPCSSRPPPLPAAAAQTDPPA